MGFAESWADAECGSAVAEKRITSLIKARGASSFGDLLAPGGGAMTFGESYSRSQASQEAYRLVKNWVAACVFCVAKRAASQSWMAGHYERPSNGERRPGILTAKGYQRALIPRTLRKSQYTADDIEQDPEHPVLWLLDKPNHHQGKFELVYMTVANLLLTGEWYWVGGITGEGKNQKAELWAVPSAWIQPDHRKGIFRGFILQTGTGQGVPLPAENVARGYFPDPSNIKGCWSPLSSCAQSANIDNYILNSQEASFERGINPNLIVTIGKYIGPDGKPQASPPRLTGPQRRQIIRAVRHIWSQTVSQGDPAILDGLIEDVKKLQMTPQEMDWQNSGMTVKARIMQAFGVNPIVLGEVTPANKAQAVVAESNFLTNVVNPILNGISTAASEFFTPFYEDGETLAVWLEQAVAKDDEMEFRKFTEARKQGDINQDEFRAFIGVAPVAEKDKEPERSPLFHNPQTMAQVAALAAQVSAGAMTHDNAVQTLVVMLQISKADADKMMPDDPPEPPPGMALPGAAPVGLPPPPVAEPKPAAGKPGKPKPKPAKPPAEEEAEPEKGYNPDQPRDEAGRWGSGGGGADTTAGSGAMGEVPISDHAAAVLDQWTTPATGSRTGEYEEIRKRGEAWVKGAEDEGFQQLYDETQARLSAEGISEMTAYRGIELPHDHPLAKAVMDGKLGGGDSFDAKGMALNSWSEEAGIATRFADSVGHRAGRQAGTRKTIGLVLERTVPAADIVSGERVHKGFLGNEAELIVRNTGSATVRIKSIHR